MCSFRPNGDLVHVHAWTRVKHGAALGNRNYGKRISATKRCEGCAVNWVDCNVGVWRTAIANALAVVEHWGFVFFAFANNDNAVHAHGVEHVAHGIYCCTIGCVLVTSPYPS